MEPFDRAGREKRMNDGMYQLLRSIDRTEEFAAQVRNDLKGLEIKVASLRERAQQIGERMEKHSWYEEEFDRMGDEDFGPPDS